MLSTRSPKPCKSRWTKSPEGEGPHASSLELWALQDSQQTLPNLLAMPSKPTGGTGGRQDSRHISSTAPTPFQGCEPGAQGCPKAVAVSYKPAHMQTAKHQEEGGIMYCKLPGSGSRGKGVGNSLLHTPSHQTTTQIGKEQGKRDPSECSQAGRVGDISKAQCQQDLLGWLHGCSTDTAHCCLMPCTYHLLPLRSRQFPAHGKF